MQIAAQALVTLAGYVTAVVLARELGPAVFGAYSIIYSLLLTTEVVGRLGVPQALIKLSAQQNEGRAAVELAGALTSLAIYILLFILFWLSAPFLADLMSSPGGGWYYRLAALDLPFFGLYFIGIAILNGRQQFQLTALVTSIYAVSKILAVLVVVMIGATIEGALIANVAASIVSVVVAVSLIGWIDPRLDRTALRKIIHLAIPLSVRGASNQILAGIGLWAIGMAGVAVAADVKGYFAASLSISRIPTILSIGVAEILIAMVAASLGRGAREEARSIVHAVSRAMMILLLPAALGIIVEAAEIMRLVFSDDYAEGANFLAILVVGQGLGFTFMVVLSCALVGASRAGWAVWSGAIGVAAAISAMLILLPLYGATGSAIATTIGCCAGAVVAGWQTWRIVGPWFDLRDVVKILGLTTPVLIAASLVETQGFAFILEAVTLGACLLGLFALFGVLTRDDVTLLMGRPRRAGSATDQATV